MSTTEHVKQIIKRLEDEIYHVHSVEKTFENLFISSDTTRNLLLKSDSAVFHDLYIVYLNYVSVSVARLFDPAESFKKKNLSLFCLLDALKILGFDGIDGLIDRLDKCRVKAYNFIEPRNQLIAHLDFEKNFDGDGKCVPSYLAREFDDVYASIGAIMNDVRSKLGMPPSMYDWGITNHGHGRKLIHCLESATKYFER